MISKLSQVNQVCKKSRFPVALLLAMTLYAGGTSVTCVPALGNSSMTSADLKKNLVTTNALNSSEQEATGQMVLTSSLARVKSLNDYSVDTGVVTYQKKKDILETAKYFYKKPRWLRIEVVKAGMKSGSVVVQETTGEIKAKPGKLLKFAKVNLSADSDMLKAANGYSLLKSDYESLLSDVVNDLKQSPRKCQVSSKNLSSSIANETVRIVEVYGTNGQVEQRIAIGETSQLPVEWTIVKNGQLFSTCVWKNPHVNAGIADRVFSLAYKQ